MSTSSADEGLRDCAKYFLIHEGLLCAGTGGSGLSAVGATVGCGEILGPVMNAAFWGGHIFSGSVGDAKVVAVGAV